MPWLRGSKENLSLLRTRRNYRAAGLVRFSQSAGWSRLQVDCSCFSERDSRATFLRASWRRPKKFRLAGQKSLPIRPMSSPASCYARRRTPTLLTADFARMRLARFSIIPRRTDWIARATAARFQRQTGPCCKGRHHDHCLRFCSKGVAPISLLWASPQADRRQGRATPAFRYAYWRISRE